MRKIYSILAVLVLPAFLLLYSYTGGSPGGKTGSPGDNGATCAQCHTGTAQAQAGLISTNIPFNGYVAGETYTITVSGNFSNITKYGFELTAEDASGNKKGTYTITDPARTKTANGGKAVTHTSGGTLANGNSISWSVDWTAPESGTGAVTFYTALNATNNNGSTSGDQVYTSSRLVSEHIANPQITEVEPNVVAQDYVGNVVISGSETSWNDGVEVVSFVLHDDNNVSFDAASFTVVSDIEIDAELPSLLDQQIGEYDVYVDDLMLENGLTVAIVDGITDVSFNDKISIYPNPASDNLTINSKEGSNVKITDVSGRTVISKSNISAVEQFDVHQLNAGVYMVIITKEGKTGVKKLLIQK